MGAAIVEDPSQGSMGGEEKIFVSVRLRPLNEREIGRKDASDWECINDTTVIYRNNLSVSERSMYPTAYTFDRVFSPDSSTRQVYEDGAKEVALAVVSGINSSVFAYGQTSSGKTFTMSGITEFTVADIYGYMEKHKEREFILKFSAMEIYNESVRDLLSADPTPLRLLDDPERGTVVERLTEETVSDWNHFKELLSLCEAQRQIGETNLNEASSRSHQILRLTIESSAREFIGNDKSSTLSAAVNFVDLAGSERASQSLSAGMRLKEGCHINRSLLTLGTVIRKLSKGRNGHIPFRDSKLTRILQSSLGGNARTAIICTMSPARSHVEQSRNTLLFASCAKEVTTNAQVNVVMSDKALVKQLQRELAKLESELRSMGPKSIASDSTALMREKDLQIEKLMKEVAELTQQLDLTRSQVDDLLQAAEDDRPATAWVDPGCQYPKLRVRHSWKSENSVSHSPSEDHHSIRLRSYEASQCSDVHSSISSDENIGHFAEFGETFLQKVSSPVLTSGASNFVGNNPCEKDNKENTSENLGNICKEVHCITVDESSINRYAHSSMSESSPGRFADSVASSPCINTGTSGLTEVENEDSMKQELESPQFKEKKELNELHSVFITPSPETPSPWLLKEGIVGSGSLKLIRSTSCRARLTHNLSPYWFEKEKDESTQPTEFEKVFTGRPEGCQRKLSPLKYDLNGETSLRNGSRTSTICSVALDERKMQSIVTLTEWNGTSISNLDVGMMEVTDHLVEETKPNHPVSAKDVKDVGVDPIQDDTERQESAQKWPSEFRRLQREIIELWHACNVSLVHRTYFILLFKGDPTDSFYMEVEHRRLSFLRNTFSQGNRTMLDGQILSPNASKKALSQERQMLSKLMQKKLSREERENIFLKWGIPLSQSRRRLRLAHCLWTKTAEMDHISESATLVAKLVGFEEQEQAFKEMFGLLNFMPKCQRRRKSSPWKCSVLSIL